MESNVILLFINLVLFYFRGNRPTELCKLHMMCYLYSHTHTPAHLCRCMYACTHMFTHTYECICTHPHTHANTHTSTHTHTHTIFLLTMRSSERTLLYPHVLPLIPHNQPSFFHCLSTSSSFLQDLFNFHLTWLAMMTVSHSNIYSPCDDDHKFGPKHTTSNSRNLHIPNV